MNKFDKDIEFYVLLKEGKYFLIFFFNDKILTWSTCEIQCFSTHTLSLSLSFSLSLIPNKGDLR